jgi:glutathione synthase/RimK-type ligase-like ATP-grasp enzyme
MNPELTGDEAAKLRALVVATQATMLGARIAIALADVGFHVAALTPHGHPVRRSRTVRNHFTYCRRLWLRLTVRALDQWSPDLLVCADDLAVRQLQSLYRRTASSEDKTRLDICKLIELSFGPAASFPAMRNKSDFLLRAANEGLRCPTTVVIPAGRELEALPTNLNYPILAKADQSYGGICVRIVNSGAAVRATIWELQTPATWHGIFRRLFGTILGSATAAPLKLLLRRTISLQHYIRGRPANRAVVCWKGNVLAGISVEAVEVMAEHGPASVVRVIDHPDMAISADHMVKCLNLSGFIGFDFILDSSNRAWIIEMNPRVTPICHLSLADGTNLAASLYVHMSGRPPSKLSPFIPELIALFPHEVVRSPSSEYLRRGRHDVPWSEPEVVRSVLNQAMRVGIRNRMRTFVERYPSIVNALVRFGIMVARAR